MVETDLDHERHEGLATENTETTKVVLREAVRRAASVAFVLRRLRIFVVENPARSLNYGWAMRTRRDETQCVVRWTFLRGNDLLTCQIHRQSSGGFRLSLVPFSPKGMSGIQTFSSIFSALQRHAAIAAELRQAGWMVVAYSETPQTPTTHTLPDAIAA